MQYSDKALHGRFLAFGFAYALLLAFVGVFGAFVTLLDQDIFGDFSRQNSVVISIFIMVASILATPKILRITQKFYKDIYVFKEADRIELGLGFALIPVYFGPIVYQIVREWNRRSLDTALDLINRTWNITGIEIADFDIFNEAQLFAFLSYLAMPYLFFLSFRAVSRELQSSLSFKDLANSGLTKNWKLASTQLKEQLLYFKKTAFVFNQTSTPTALKVTHEIVKSISTLTVTLFLPLHLILLILLFISSTLTASFDSNVAHYFFLATSFVYSTVFNVFALSTIVMASIKALAFTSTLIFIPVFLMQKIFELNGSTISAAERMVPLLVSTSLFFHSPVLGVAFLGFVGFAFLNDLLVTRDKFRSSPRIRAVVVFTLIITLYFLTANVLFPAAFIACSIYMFSTQILVLKEEFEISNVVRAAALYAVINFALGILAVVLLWLVQLVL